MLLFEGKKIRIGRILQRKRKGLAGEGVWPQKETNVRKKKKKEIGTCQHQGPSKN